MFPRRMGFLVVPGWGIGPGCESGMDICDLGDMASLGSIRPAIRFPLPCRYLWVGWRAFVAWWGVYASFTPCPVEARYVLENIPDDP
jgi:hypothetical protein